MEKWQVLPDFGPGAGPTITGLFFTVSGETKMYVNEYVYVGHYCRNNTIYNFYSDNKPNILEEFKHRNL